MLFRSCEWTEIDFDATEWRIPAEKMKMRREHIVPLSTQAVNIFREAQRLVLRILKLANSAAYGMTRHMSNISEAIALLGYKNVSNIVLAATVYSVMDVSKIKLYRIRNRDPSPEAMGFLEYLPIAGMLNGGSASPSR